MRNIGGIAGVLMLSILVGTGALSQTGEPPNDAPISSRSPAPAPIQSEMPLVDGGVDQRDAGASDDIATSSDTGGGASSEPTPELAIRDDERPPVEEKKEAIHWRHDPTLRRRPGSYIGGVIGYAMGHAWYTTTQKDLTLDYHIGPSHLQATSVRVGDAFFDWLSVGSQVSFLTMPILPRPEKEDPQMGAFGLYLDTTFYPWRGLGLRPSLGMGFSFAQAGTKSFELGFGGPANLAFSVSYEFRVLRLLTIGPMVQVSWITSEDYDAFFLFIGLEMLKWFQTAMR